MISTALLLLFFARYSSERNEMLFQAAAVLAAGLTTAPERMQLVQTRIFLLLPAETTTLTLCKLGSQRLLVLL
jgi:hypothetical protein